MKALMIFVAAFCFFPTQVPAATRSSLEAYKELRTTAFSAQASLGERWAALQKIGKQDFKLAKKDLIKALQAKEWFVRNAALLALPQERREFVRQWSERLLFDKALVVRTQAIKNLIQIKARESAPKIYKALNDKINFRGDYSLWVRPYLAQALALYPPKNWKQVYQKMLSDKDEKVQLWAVIGLEEKSGLHLGTEKDSIETKRMKWLSYFKN